MTLTLDHVGVLVADLSAALPLACARLELEAGPVESFPDEGTRECYLGSGPARLLLLEAIGPGPYRSALERRGPGLHHLGYQFAGPLQESLPLLPGWLLHPHSLVSMSQGTLWLARPGVPLLLEITRGETAAPSDLVVEVPVSASDAARLFPHLPGLRSTIGEPALLRNGRMLTMAELAGPPVQQ